MSFCRHPIDQTPYCPASTQSTRTARSVSRAPPGRHKFRAPVAARAPRTAGLARRGTDHVQACALYDAGACLPIGAAGVQGRRYHTRMATATSRAASAKHPGAFGVR